METHATARPSHGQGLVTGPAALVLGLLVIAAAACAPSRATPSPPDPAAVAAAITRDGLEGHLEALDRIARENGGSRGTGTPGDESTVEYVKDVLGEAGYATIDDAFETAVYLDPGGSELVVLDGAGGDRTFEDGHDVRAMLFSPTTTVEGPVAAIGWDGDARTADGAGCAAADYAGIARGSIVLVRPGDCLRRGAVAQAQAAGAAALVTAVPWAARDEVRQVTLVDPSGLDIPALAASGDVGDALAEAAASGGRARISTTGTTEQRLVRSVFAELVGADPERVVMIGAHLDSAMNGPGINDDGTGIAALLEIAQAVAGTRPAVTIRFAFWAAEEPGLKGSARYVTRLSAEERGRIVAYLNADMLGSPNGFPGVYDESGATPGSDEIRDLLGADLDAAGVAWEPIDTGGGSDHRPFEVAGIPTGGLLSGASGFVTAEQAARHGIHADRPPDPCYHLACDDLANVDAALLETLARSLARVTLQLTAATAGAASSP